MSFGALVPPIKEQLTSQGIICYVPSCEIEAIQDDADAIVRLNIRNILPDSAVRKARERLMRKLTRVLTQSSKK